MEPYLGDDEVFMATYGDGLTDVDLPHLVRTFEASAKMIMFALRHPHFHAHIVEADSDGTVRDVRPMNTAGVRINGGFFVLRREVFDWIAPGDELVEETFASSFPAGRSGPTDTTASSVRWTPLRTGSGSRSCSDPVARRGCASDSNHGDDRRVMLALRPGGKPVQRLLAIGAHSDDLEIGCGGTILALTQAISDLLCTGSCSPRRASAATRRARAPRACSVRRRERHVEVHDFRDGYLPHTSAG